MSKSPQLPPSPIRYQLCGEAEVSEPTLRKYLTGQRVQPGSAYRIERAAKALGLEHLMPPKSEPGEGQP